MLTLTEDRAARGYALAQDANASATGLKQNQGKYVQTGTGPAYWGPGDEVTFLITGEETGGAVFMAELSVPPAGGPPPHIHHREDESFYVREGTLAIRMGDRTVNAAPGDFVHIPRGTVHCFKNTGNGHAKMLVTFTPAGMEKFFEEAFHPAGDRSASPPLLTEELLARLLGAAAKSGLEFSPARIALERSRIFDSKRLRNFLPSPVDTENDPRIRLGRRKDQAARRLNHLADPKIFLGGLAFLWPVRR